MTHGTMNGPLTYIAGPYGSDPIGNTRLAIKALHALLDGGVPAICPHLSMLADFYFERKYEDWMGLDLVLVERCDVVLRLPGHSPGADREVEHADMHGIPVVYVSWWGLDHYAQAVRNADLRSKP